MDKPLHVRVAEIASGTTYTLSPYVVINGRRVDAPTWLPGWDYCSADNPPCGHYAHWEPPRYDKDWGVTGPLMIRLGISLQCMRREDGTKEWRASLDVPNGRGMWGSDPLECVCWLIVRIAESGHLASVA